MLIPHEQGRPGAQLCNQNSSLTLLGVPFFGLSCLVRASFAHPHTPATLPPTHQVYGSTRALCSLA